MFFRACSRLHRIIRRSHVNTIIQSLQMVEGLLTKGAMKPDDRPLWFDVYRAFPPTIEPKFARPKPELKPIRQILYPEDAIRAKFHSHGVGLAPINISSETETQVKKLVQQYNKLKAEGVAEEELIEKSVETVSSERQLEASKTKEVPKQSETRSTEVDLKNIFND